MRKGWAEVDHKWLEDFIALARERSFSRAAEQRHVTQPQFSRRIRALELWVGADLINRAGMPLSLTAAGEALLPVASRAVASLSDARERIRHAQGGLNWVTLATGRDFLDVSPMRGVIRGGARHVLDVAVTVEPVEEPAVIPHSEPAQKMQQDTQNNMQEQGWMPWTHQQQG